MTDFANLPIEVLNAVSAAVQIVQWRASTALNSAVEALH